jgi:hypothetical protein
MPLHNTDEQRREDISEKRIHHCVMLIAPSIHEVELKNMPWWWMELGSSRPL